MTIVSIHSRGNDEDEKGKGDEKAGLTMNRIRGRDMFECRSINEHVLDLLVINVVLFR